MPLSPPLSDALAHTFSHSSAMPHTRIPSERAASRMEELNDIGNQPQPTNSDHAGSMPVASDPFADSRGCSSATSSAAPSLHEYQGSVGANRIPPQHRTHSPQRQHQRMTRGDSTQSTWLGHTSYYGYGGASNPSTPGGEPMLTLGGFCSPPGAATPISTMPSLRSLNAPSVQRGSHVSGTVTPSHVKPRQRRVFKSTVLVEGEEVHKPWLDSKARKSANRKAYWLFVMGVVIGLLSVVAVTYTGWTSVKQHSFCLVLDESFSGDAINPNIWFHEQEVGGFGNHEFEWTTDSTNNSYIKDNQLYIVPTLTSDHFGMDAITNGYELNLTTLGTCTAANPDDASACSVTSNSSTGTILPPIQSARLVTNFSTSIKYGRVEVRAKMPKGDWIWPAVWMMPKDSVYGSWPRSGEIDIFESRGNVLKHKDDDFGNWMHSTLHWGPSISYDEELLTTNAKQLYRKYFNQDFHTLGMEWTPEGLYTYYDNPNNKVLAWKFSKTFWDLGDFPAASSNGTTLTDPWPANGNIQAPFDQEFYLILNVAVGGTNGWFKEDDMPWSNDAENARGEFWSNRDQWLSTWGNEYDRGMVVDSVKMWNLEGVEGVTCPTTPLTN